MHEPSRQREWAGVQKAATDDKKKKKTPRGATICPFTPKGATSLLPVILLLLLIIVQSWDLSDGHKNKSNVSGHDILPASACLCWAVTQSLWLRPWCWRRPFWSRVWSGLFPFQSCAYFCLSRYHPPMPFCVWSILNFCLLIIFLQIHFGAQQLAFEQSSYVQPSTVSSSEVPQLPESQNEVYHLEFSENNSIFEVLR